MVMRTRVTLLLAFLLPATAGCLRDAGDDWYPEHGALDSAGGPEGLTFLEADAAGEVPVDPEVTVGLVGTACEAKADCVTGYCMTTQNIGAFIKGAEIPNGYCSALFCAVDGSDGACTPAMGGVCFSLYPFLGESFGAKGICLSPCDADGDCRAQDSNVCFHAQSLVDAGLMDPAVLAAYYAGASSGCLPQSVATAAVEKLKLKQ
jgi:hypothetical protein